MRRLPRRRFLQVLGAGAAFSLAGRLRGGPLKAVEDSVLPERTLGKTGERVPILGLGTAAMGRRVADAEAVALIHEALDLGVRYIDTAPALGGYGRAQLQIGQALQGRRAGVFLVTKCFEPDGDAALRLLERNLRELQSDAVDLVYAHSIGANEMDPTTVFGPSGVLRALQRAKEEGLTRFIGVSGHNRPRRFLRALEEFDLDVMMTAVNFADRHTYNFEGDVWPLARAKGVGLVAMKVFGGDRRQRALMSDEHHELALRYALSLDGCATAVVGMVRRSELLENVARARSFQPLSEQEAAALVQPGRALAESWGAHYGALN